MTTRRMFIAGATCPRCGVVDRIRLCRDGAREWMDCVACGYESAEPPAPEHPQEAAPADAETGAVKWLPGTRK